jgi:hypothetical protein
VSGTVFFFSARPGGAAIPATIAMLIGKHAQYFATYGRDGTGRVP